MVILKDSMKRKGGQHRAITISMPLETRAKPNTMAPPSLIDDIRRKTRR